MDVENCDEILMFFNMLCGNVRLLSGSVFWGFVNVLENGGDCVR